VAGIDFCFPPPIDPRSTYLKGNRIEPAVEGIATFTTLRVDKQGLYTIRFSVGGLVTADSAPFSVALGPRAKLSVSQVCQQLHQSLHLIQPLSKRRASVNFLPPRPARPCLFFRIIVPLEIMAHKTCMDGWRQSINALMILATTTGCARRAQVSRLPSSAAAYCTRPGHGRQHDSRRFRHERDCGT